MNFDQAWKVCKPIIIACVAVDILCVLVLIALVLHPEGTI